MSTETSQRSGILAGGNFIIDHVKIIDDYPGQDMLANISTESSHNGGGPYNILKDLAKMGAAFPLEAAGLIGRDPDGDWILADCHAHDIDTAQLHQTGAAHTSYTDAMTVESTGRRTFFHQQGANALLDAPHFDFSKTRARIFHLGYLMLLRTMDALDADGRTPAAGVLAAAGEAGLVTSCEMVSTDAADFRAVALASIPYVDHLFVNEVEAGLITGATLRDPATNAIALPAVTTAARELLTHGVRREVIVHFPEGAVVAERTGDTLTKHPSLALPDDFSQGATGAGDAFAAGYLHGLHEDQPVSDRLRLAVSTAAACLTHPSTSEGLRLLPDCLGLAEQYGFRTLDENR